MEDSREQVDTGATVRQLLATAGWTLASGRDQVQRVADSKAVNTMLAWKLVVQGPFLGTGLCRKLLPFGHVSKNIII